MASVPLFREEDHPRADDGKFTDKGARSGLRKIDQVRKAQNPGTPDGHTKFHTTIDSRGELKHERRVDMSTLPKIHPKVKQAMADHIKRMLEIMRHEQEQGLPPGQHGEEWRKMVQDDYVRLQIAKREAERDIEAEYGRDNLKREAERMDSKGANLKKKQERVLRELEELELHIDNLEERYADREGGSITEMKFPDEESKREFDELRKKRDDLEKLYDQLERRRKRHG